MIVPVRRKEGRNRRRKRRWREKERKREDEEAVVTEEGNETDGRLEVREGK